MTSTSFVIIFTLGAIVGVWFYIMLETFSKPKTKPKSEPKPTETTITKRYT